LAVKGMFLLEIKSFEGFKGGNLGDLLIKLDEN
jgi:hypothetical protein